MPVVSFHREFAIISSILVTSMIQLALQRDVIKRKDKIAQSWEKENRGSEVHKKAGKILFLPHYISWFKRHSFYKTSVLDIITATSRNKTHVPVGCLGTSLLALLSRTRISHSLVHMQYPWEGRSLTAIYKLIIDGVSQQQFKKKGEAQCIF